jgi:hypothetical protein
MEILLIQHDAFQLTLCQYVRPLILCIKNERDQFGNRLESHHDDWTVNPNEMRAMQTNDSSSTCRWLGQCLAVQCHQFNVTSTEHIEQRKAVKGVSLPSVQK